MSKWKKTPLGSIGEAFIGLTYKPEDISSNGIIVLRSGNIQHNEIDLHEIIRVNKDIKNKLIIRNNDILICSRNGSSNLVGKSALITDILEQMTFGAFMMVYRSHYNKYLHHFMQSPYFKRQLNRSATTTINQITKSMLDKIVVSLPPLEEQHKIASILDTVSEALKLRKQQLNELDLLVKSKFIEMFGDPIENPMKWEHIILNDICDIGSSKRIYESEYVSNGIPFYRTKEIVELNKGNSISTELFISIERFNEIKSKYSVPKKNDILISAVGTIGTIWVVDGKEDFYFKDGNLLLIKASNKFSSIYMSFLLENLIGYYKQGLSSGTAYCALTIEKLKCMKAFNPPIELQNKFASFVQYVDELKSEVQKSIDQLQTLFDSLMQQYFE